MIEIKSKLRKWGNSFGVIIPIGEVKDENIKEGDEVTVLVKREGRNVLRETFGTLKNWKIDTQKFKDEIRKEEYEAEKRKWKNIS
ncbi:MAG: AbrB/MazE/SpoVT family DNA-binding domain-containing protein [Candidatus Woesearchaeota archaeon]